MARQKKTRKISDIMPMRKADKKVTQKDLNQGRRFERDLQSRLEQKKRKHKGLASGSRNAGLVKKVTSKKVVTQDSRLGSRKKVPLMVEEVVGKNMLNTERKPAMDPYMELTQLENNECLNQLLDDIEAGNVLSPKDQAFVDDCLARIQVLMEKLGLLADQDEKNQYYQDVDKLDSISFY